MADPSYPAAAADETPVATPAHTQAEEQFLADLYAELKPQAVEGYINYFLARTPAHLQNDMKDLISADLAVPPTAPVTAMLARSDAGHPKA